DAKNFAYADPALVKAYTDYAAAGALADRYFQPIIGQSSSNDMYFARAGYAFTDNEVAPPSIGAGCKFNVPQKGFSEQTIADLVIAKGFGFTWYGEGYDAMIAADGGCPAPPPECLLQITSYPCVYDPGDVPFEFYASTRDNPKYIKDFTKLADDL